VVDQHFRKTDQKAPNHRRVSIAFEVGRSAECADDEMRDDSDELSHVALKDLLDFQLQHVVVGVVITRGSQYRTRLRPYLPNGGVEFFDDRLVDVNRAFFIEGVDDVVQRGEERFNCGNDRFQPTCQRLLSQLRL